MSKIINNVVPKHTMREIQTRTLDELAEILKLSFGPNGSTSCIKKENALTRYTKDGHSIIGALHYNGIIEQSIKDDVESITRHIVKTVGDGTTSAVILSSLIFKNLIKLEDRKYKPVEIVTALEEVVADLKKMVKEKAKPMTPQDVFDIAMISTNSNLFIANTLRDIYEEFGNSVFIDVTPSTGEETIVKSYNGMTLNTGYCDSCYVTNASKNTAEISNPEVYFFEHPIDTREMGVLLDAILSTNITGPYQHGAMDQIIPTVIFAPTISQDMSSIMDSLVSVMAKFPASNRLPICVITGYHEVGQLMDLAKMCGAKMIRKYIDAETYANDVEKGLAPTPKNITTYAGLCDQVIAYSDKTTFIRPHEMYNEDGSYSNLYENLLGFLETEIANATADGQNIKELNTLKRRLYSLKSSMVELFIGGVTEADRDSLRDLVEDAVLNIRSASKYGVGMAANMTITLELYDMAKFTEMYEDSELKYEIYDAFDRAYTELSVILFGPCGVTPPELIANAKNGAVYNIREKQWTMNVKSSIMSDIVILDTVTKIVGIMATCNQFIVPTAMHNIYIA